MKEFMTDFKNMSKFEQGMFRSMVTIIRTCIAGVVVLCYNLNKVG